MPAPRLFTVGGHHARRIHPPAAPGWVYAMPGPGRAYVTFGLVGDATGYQVTASTGQTVSVTLAAAAEPVVVGGLTNGAPVTFTVAATSSHGPSAGAVSAAVTPTGTPTVRWGTLGGQQFASTQAAKDGAAGLTLGMLELGWNSYQPTNTSTTASAYVASMQLVLSQMQLAGLQLCLSLGAHNEPAWITGDNSLKFVGEDGVLSTNLNCVFRTSARLLWQTYVDRIHTDLGLNSFRAIRITSVADGEFLYPAAPARKYFAFDTAAQTGVGLAAGQTVCPYPGWIPGGGDTSIGTAGSGLWINWYLQSLVNCADWQMKYLRTKGYTGVFEVLMPGAGVRPSNYATDIATYLPLANLLCVGAVWDQIYLKLAALSNAGSIYAHLSSVGDQSGTVPDDVPVPADLAVPITSTSANGWSATRWGTRLAHEYGFPISGENTGYSVGFAGHYTDQSDAGLMVKAIAQAAAAGMVTFYWAHDNKIADGTITLRNYVAAIGRFGH